MATQILIRNSKDSLLLLQKCKEQYGLEHVSMFVKSDISLAVVLKIDDLLNRSKSQLSDLHYGDTRLWHWELHADHRGISSIWLDNCSWNEEKETDETGKAEEHLRAFMEDEQQEEE